jgi:hypothetical protein
MNAALAVQAKKVGNVAARQLLLLGLEQRGPHGLEARLHVLLGAAQQDA